jgi:tetratricopeptide (TPR) repeat protein
MRAGKLLKKGADIAAISMLKKATRLQPSDYKIQKNLAGAYKQSALSKSDVTHLKQFMEKSKQHYLAAMQLNPFDVSSVFGLALVESQLEKAELRLKNNKNPDSHKTRTYFERAIGLNPNQTYHRYALIHYLHSHNQTDSFLQGIRVMTRINPETYHYLKRESFWSSPVKEAAIQGLNRAIKENIMPLEAYLALSELFDKDKQIDRAVQAYKKMVALKPSSDKNIFDNYIRLGQLNLKRGRFELAVLNFLTALDLSEKRDDTLEQIYRVYQRERCDAQYEQLHLRLKRHYFDPVRADLIYARSFFDHKNYAKAKQIFDKIINLKPVAPAYYYLARIAQSEKDWDAMERASVNAMALDPNNVSYIQMLYSVYWQLGKLEILESELDKAIERLETPSSRLFEGRARLRLKRKDFAGAIKDWKAAIRLTPKRSYCYVQLAETYLKSGDLNKASACYQQAISINPRNKNYPKRLKEIKAKAS